MVLWRLRYPKKLVEDHTVRWVVLCFHTVHRLILIAVYENSICLKDFQPDILNSFLRSFDLCLRWIFLLLAWWINGWLALQRCQHLCFNYSICWGDTEGIWKWHFSCFSDQTRINYSWKKHRFTEREKDAGCEPGMCLMCDSILSANSLLY